MTKQHELVEIGNRRELFIDDYLIAGFDGRAEQRLHHPVAREIVIEHDAPWEGNVSGFHTVFRDAELYRMYYRGANADANHRTTHPQVTCYAESRDGIHWQKPNLGLYSFVGMKDEDSGCDYTGWEGNNIVWAGRNAEDWVGVHNFVPFKDTNPDCSAQARYKAVGSGKVIVEGEHYGGLLPFHSADGLHWQVTEDQLIIQDGRFDSQNLAFFDSVRGEYRAYWRDLRPHTSPLHDRGQTRGTRDIKTATSPDFRRWSNEGFLQYGSGAPMEHLYTNQIQPYYRAPHIFIGFPTRYLPDRGSVTEGLLMCSRDGKTFHRWEDAIIRPGLNPARWGNRSNYIWCGMVETESDVPGAPAELSIYGIEGYYEGTSNCVRRFTFRQDGFVSLHAPFAGGEVLTKQLRIAGARLELNVSTSAAGMVAVEIHGSDGRPISGFALDDCDVVYGDQLSRVVTWNGSADLGRLTGQVVRLRLVLSDADVFSLQFSD